MGSAERSDDELLAETRRDTEAVGTFYRRHGEAVFRYMLSGREAPRTRE